LIGRFPGETSALSLVWAALEPSSRGWRGVLTTPKSVAEIERLRHGSRPRATATRSREKEVVAA
jgi:putative transposase